MDKKEFIKKYFSETAEILQKIDINSIEKAVDFLMRVKSVGGRVFFAGVGGGAGTGSHASNDFNKIAGISSVCLSDNISLLTALANDEGLESVFTRQLQMHNLNNNDCLFIFSVGGGSERVSANLVSAIKYAKGRGACVIGVVGDETGYTARNADACILTPLVNIKNKTPHTEDFQLIMDHLIVNLIASLPKRAVFFDRDGTLNKAVIRKGAPSCPWKMEELELFPEAHKVLSDLKNMGFENIVFTNQPDIKRGFLTEEETRKISKKILSELPVSEVRFCPHDDSDNCACRKPKAGMLFDSAEKNFVDLSRSFVVGDSWRDMEAGKTAGCKTIFLRRDYNGSFQNGSDFTANNLNEVFEIIKNFK